MDNPKALATSGTIADVDGEENKLRIIQGESTVVAFSPALFFGEGSNYLLRSERLLVNDE